MASSRMKFRAILSLLLCLPAFPLEQKAIAAEKATEEKAPILLPHMQIAYQSLIKILGTMARPDDPLKRAEFKQTEDQLKVLNEQAQIIHQLVKKDEKGREFISAELESNSKLAYDRFRSGHREQAKFYISDVVNSCFSCHTSRSSAVDSRFTTAFLKDLDGIDMDPLAKARFLSLSRQFEASELAYEQVFSSKEINLDEFINFDPLVEYLILTLRVRDDAPRALKTLDGLKKRNLPAVVQREITAWAQTLRTSKALSQSGSSSQKAESLMRLGRGSMEFPRDRTGVVEFILASKYLREYLNEKGLEPAAKAKAYYDLGGCELVLGTSFASDEANVYFAEAIRLVPKSDLAKKAYARYEENIYSGYSGSSGVHIPQDEKENLIALKKLAY